VPAAFDPHSYWMARHFGGAALQQQEEAAAAVAAAAAAAAAAGAPSASARPVVQWWHDAAATFGEVGLLDPCGHHTQSGSVSAGSRCAAFLRVQRRQRLRATGSTARHSTPLVFLDTPCALCLTLTCLSADSAACCVGMWCQLAPFSHHTRIIMRCRSCHHCTTLTACCAVSVYLCPCARSGGKHALPRGQSPLKKRVRHAAGHEDDGDYLPGLPDEGAFRVRQLVVAQ
jgi:hypothetical protein